jgi:hypothetical protein
MNNLIESLSTPIRNLKSLILDYNELTDNDLDRIIEVLILKNYKLKVLSLNGNEIELNSFSSNYLGMLIK